ncbi:hypothetical protein MIC448_1860003 [Microbacterium sp. C448]|nr:hypothetical protein MIC448_1860003 [Microbacterium sp. C448]
MKSWSGRVRDREDAPARLMNRTTREPQVRRHRFLDAPVDVLSFDRAETGLMFSRLGAGLGKWSHTRKLDSLMASVRM